MRGILLVLLLAAASAAEPPPLRPDYLAAHPRLLFGPGDLPALQERSRRHPALWQPVQAAAARLRTVPDAATIREGKRYYRIDTVFAGALASSVGGDAAARAAAIAWMTAHCQVEVWGTGWRENIDIPANWYMYYIALGYDILHADIPAADRAVIERGLAAHAEAVFQAWKREERIPYDQNHTYVPLIGLAAAALALHEVEPRAAGWLAFARGLMAKCRAVLPADGWYYEGTGYWEYAFHWHVRYADLLARATGEDAFALPMFAANHLYAAHLSLPGPPWLFDLGDTGHGTGRRVEKRQLGRKGMLHRLAAVRRDPVIQGVAEHLRGGSGEWDDAGMQFLWQDPDLPATPVAQLPTFHRFADHGAIAWRSSWGEDATVLQFGCAPPLGYAAAGLLAAMPEWKPNTGHAHPDLGAFLLYARGAYLASDTGYSGRKRTRDHNTILVDGQGMGADPSYWVFSGFPDRDLPYATWTGARLERVHLEPAYAYALADLSGVYPAALGGLRLRRHLVATADVVVILDDLAGDRPHVFTSMLHADAPFTPAGPIVHQAAVGPALLRHHLFAAPAAAAEPGPAMVMNYTKGPNNGEDEQRGFQLAVSSAAPTARQRFVHILVPLAAGQPAPQVELRRLDETRLEVVLTTAGTARSLSVDLCWLQDAVPGPVTLGP